MAGDFGIRNSFKRICYTGIVKITKDYLMKISREVLSFLREHGVKQPHDLGHLIDDSPWEKIDVFRTGKYPDPNQQYGSEYVVRYLPEKKIVPLEIRVNPYVNYFSIRIKCQSPAIGYRSFSRDPFGNLPQEKFLGIPRMSVVELMLDQLTKPETYRMPCL